jgi:hypothetical protein
VEGGRLKARLARHSLNEDHRNMTEDIGSTLATVEVITKSYATTGNCRGLSERLRLIDLLNNPEITHLQLTDVKVRLLPNATEIVTGRGPIFIDKKSVILGRSLTSPEDEARREEAHRFDHVQKEKELMLVFASPYRILGNVYLVKDADPSIALPKLFEGFLAMTEVKTVQDGEGGVEWDDEFVAVNGRNIDMVYLSMEAQGAPAADAPIASDEWPDIPDVASAAG